MPLFPRPAVELPAGNFSSIHCPLPFLKESGVLQDHSWGRRASGGLCAFELSVNTERGRVQGGQTKDYQKKKCRSARTCVSLPGEGVKMWVRVCVSFPTRQLVPPEPHALPCGQERASAALGSTTHAEAEVTKALTPRVALQ